MELSVAKEKFICNWGSISTHWGINKTMGQIHALLLVSKEDICTDMIMTALGGSRGNTSMSLRTLEGWGLIYKIHKTGDRKDYYRAEKDPAKMLQLIVSIRKKKELDPLLALLESVNQVVPRCPSSDEFCRVTRSIRAYAQKAELALSTMSSSKMDWLNFMVAR